MKETDRLRKQIKTEEDNMDKYIFRAVLRDASERGYDLDDILDDCLEEKELEDYEQSLRARNLFQEQLEGKKIWEEISDLEEEAIKAYREHSEWGIFLEALCDSDLEAYNRLMKLYKMVNHKTYWRK